MEDLIKIQEEEFSVEDILRRVKSSSREIGGIVTFSGIARDISRGQKIRSLDFEHYPGMADERLREIRKRALRTFNVIEMAIVHRVGRIEIGENIVVIVAAARHRNDAFMACEWAIAELKRTVPIWKKETTEGGEVWVEEHP